MEKIKLHDKPLYELVRERLLDLMSSFAVGDQLPSEAELSRRFGVSRNTLREALKILNREGWIEQVHGAGTFVSRLPRVIENGLESLESINSVAKRKGWECTTEELDFQSRTASRRIKKKLKLNKGDKITEVSRILKINGSRVAYLEDIVPEKIIPCKELKEEVSNSVLDYIISRGRPAINYAYTEIEPISASEELASLFKVEHYTNLLLVKEVLMSTSNKPIEYGLNYLVADFFDFHVIRRLNKG